MLRITCHRRTSHRPFTCLLVAGIVFCVPTAPSRAEIITGLYNTGVNASGGLANDRSPDLHYRLVSSADKSLSVPGPAFVADSSRYPFIPGGWLPDGPFSKWIDPLPDQSIGNAPGDYTFQTSFQLRGGNPGSVIITGQWSVDNLGEDILINGHSTGIYYDAPGDYSFKAFQSFTLPSSFFVDGTNTLDFVVNNTDNGNGNTPIGLRLELSANAPTVPEPASLTLTGCGAIILAVYSGRAGRRRKKSPSASRRGAPCVLRGRATAQVGYFRA